MSKQFKDQGGAASMNPNPFYRWATSRLLNRIISEKVLEKRRAKFLQQRQKSKQGAVIEYFHQVEDGYSHLAAQTLQQLLDRYKVDIKCYLVNGPQGDNSPEKDLLLGLSQRDSIAVASHYGLKFPSTHSQPSKSNTNLATRILAAQDSSGFIGMATEVGQALWSDDVHTLSRLEKLEDVSDEKSQLKVAEGTKRQKDLKHYSGAMFYFEGEWYWGVDRLYHLEKRLSSLGLDQSSDEGLLFPRPQVTSERFSRAEELTFEIYPSLRSPYTAVIFDRAVQFARDKGIQLKVYPVLPMVMRGVSATREKGFYIFSDAAREAREAGLPFGKMYDPIGEPVRNCYSLYPWACQQDKGTELLSRFLKAAFVDGVNTNNNSGLKLVVENAGLNWDEAQEHLGKSEWEDELETNRLKMYESGLWGVPSFRLLDKEGSEILALWGQDRLWLFDYIIKQYSNSL